MSPDAPKKNAAPDPVRLVEASDGLSEFGAEHADRSPLTSRESRRSRASRVQEPLLLWTDAPAGAPVREPAAAAKSAPVTTQELTLGVGLDEGWSAPARFGWARLAAGGAVVALILAVVAGGILMMRRTPAPSLTDRSAPELDVPPPLDASSRLMLIRPPGVRAPQPVLAARVDQPTPPVSVRPALAGQGFVRPVAKVASASPAVVRTQPARRAGEQPLTPPAPVVSWLRPETARTAPAIGVDESVVGTAASAATGTSTAPVAPTASPAPTARADVSPQPTAAAAAAVPEAPRSSITVPPSTPGSSRTPEPARPAAAEAPVAVVAAPSKREVDTRAIETLLGRYRNGFNRLSASSVSAVWPTVDEKNLAKAFERIEDQHVSFDSCEIEIGGVAAEVICRGTARYVPRVGSRTPRDEARRWRFNLRRATDGWVIDRVVAN